MVAAAVAVLGYALLRLVQFVLLFASTVLLALAMIMSAGLIDAGPALADSDGIGPGVLTGAILVFANLGLAWATSSADLARYQRSDSSGRSSMLAAMVGLGLPPLVLISFGALLAASNPVQAAAFAIDPVGSLVGLLPGWTGIPLLLVGTLTLLSAIILNLYSGGLALAAVDSRISRPVGVLLTALGTAILAVVILVGRTGLPRRSWPCRSHWPYPLPPGPACSARRC